MKQFFLVTIYFFFKKKSHGGGRTAPMPFLKKIKNGGGGWPAPTSAPTRTTWGRSTAPMPFFKKNKKLLRRVGPPLRPPQRVTAVGQGSYSVNLSAPTQRCHVKIAGGKFDRRSAMGAVRTAPTLGKYPPQICPFFVV